MRPVGPKILSLSDLRMSQTASLFEGRDHGAEVSIFVTDHPPGAGVDLHRHPYAETFVVRGGRATFTVDDESVDARPGQIVVVPAGAAHGFVNSGDGPLHLVSVHPSDHVVQEWVREERRPDR
jgi:quercetin dioxygenase-like cupin family protein